MHGDHWEAGAVWCVKRKPGTRDGEGGWIPEPSGQES